MQPAAPSPFLIPPRPTRSPTWWWFLVPALSIGFGTFVMVFLGGWRLKSRTHQYAACGYLLADMIYFCTAALSTPADGGSPTGLAFDIILPVFMTCAWLGGTLHTVILQTRVANLAPQPPPVPVLPHSSDPAIAAAMWRASRRAEARQILKQNPAMAWELRIGRPDLQGRQYEDGGLVDVNQVPAEWLAYALQIPQPLANEIADARTRHHGFGSPDEIVVYCHSVTPEQLDMIRDFLVFRPL